MDVTFYNVTVTIEADNPKQAYDRLCNLLGGTKGEFETDWTTDTYVTWDPTAEGVRAEGPERSTDELWPEEGEEEQE